MAPKKNQKSRKENRIQGSEQGAEKPGRPQAGRKCAVVHPRAAIPAGAQPRQADLHGLSP